MARMFNYTDDGSAPRPRADYEALTIDAHRSAAESGAPAGANVIDALDELINTRPPTPDPITAARTAARDALAELDYLMQQRNEIVATLATAAHAQQIGADSAHVTQGTAPPPAPPTPSSPPPSPRTVEQLTREQITRAAMLDVLTTLATDNRIAGETRCRAATMYLQHTVSAEKTQALTDREHRLAAATPRSPQMPTAPMRKATRPVTATSGPKLPTGKQRTEKPSTIKTSSSSRPSKRSKPSAARTSRASTSRRTA